MLKTCTLYSGSTGNSIYVESNDTKILIDVGVSCKKILEALQLINVNITEIDTSKFPLLPSKYNEVLTICPTEYFEGFFVAKIHKQ